MKNQRSKIACHGSFNSLFLLSLAEREDKISEFSVTGYHVVDLRTGKIVQYSVQYEILYSLLKAN
jgi:hypothetical protein